MYRSRYLHFVWGVSKVIVAIWIYTVLIEHLHKMFSELISDQIFSHVRFSSIVLAILWIFSDRIGNGWHKRNYTNAVQSSFGLLHWRDFIW